MMLTAEKLRDLLVYEPHTGLFFWRIPRNQMSAGSKAGSMSANGYWRVSVANRSYLAHRLAWFYTHGVWPACQIDHINGNRADNRIANLRPAIQSENNANARRRRDNSSGFKGVSFHKQRGKWRAYITQGGRQRSLGLFESRDEAHAAYAQVSAHVFGEFARA